MSYYVIKDDASYVFGGFCPITIRLIEAMVKTGWNPIKELVKKQMEHKKKRCRYWLLSTLTGCDPSLHLD